MSAHGHRAHEGGTHKVHEHATVVGGLHEVCPSPHTEERVADHDLHIVPGPVSYGRIALLPVQSRCIRKRRARISSDLIEQLYDGDLVPDVFGKVVDDIDRSGDVIRVVRPLRVWSSLSAE